MNDCTFNIIILSKRKNGIYQESLAKDRIIHYLADTRLMCKDHYRDFDYILLRTLKDAMYDYIDGCEKPSLFLKGIESVKRLNLDSISDIDCIISEFSLIQVRRDGKYINGFTENQFNEYVVDEITFVENDIRNTHEL